MNDCKYCFESSDSMSYPTGYGCIRDAVLSGNCIKYMHPSECEYYEAKDNYKKQQTEYEQMKKFFECHQADKNHYEDWIKENSKTELEKAAVNYSESKRGTNYHGITEPAVTLADDELHVRWEVKL